MRILIYTHAFAPKFGGVETVVMSLAKGLARYEPHAGGAPAVTLATQTPKDTFDDASLPFSVVRRPSLWRLLPLIREADVLHLAGPAFLPMLAALALRKPVVVEHHGFQAICPNGQMLHTPEQRACPGHFMAGRHGECLRCNAPSGRLATLKLWALTFPRRWLCQRAQSNITPTDWLAGLLQLPRMQTIHHGLPVKDQANAAPLSQPPAFAFMGRLVSTKGVDVLLRAAARVKAEGLDFTLRVIGDGPERSNLEALAQALDLQDRVKFLGYQPDSTVGEALAGVAAIAMPSLAGEVFGLVALESMMRGIVPIVPEGGALAEVVGDAGLCFPPGDVKALAECLQRVLVSPDGAAALGHHARKRAIQGFNDRAMAENHLAVFRELARKPQRLKTASLPSS